MRSRALFCLSALILLGALFTIDTTSAYADVPDSINYSGILTSGGSPVADANYTVTFSIYDGSVGGIALWTETKSVTTLSGLFNTLLGSVTALPASVFTGPNRWLGMAVSPDPEMTPRTAIVAVPYAYRIATVDGATGGSISGDINLETSTAITGNILKGGTRFLHDFGTNNTFLGSNAGNFSMSGTENTASGGSALQGNTSGYGNTANGFFALGVNSSGYWNTATGATALFSNSSGSENTANGTYALVSNSTGNFNTASGTNSLYANNSGSENTANGNNTLHDNTSGTNNTASGMSALYKNITGGANTATGSAAMFYNETGVGNTASGASALISNTTGGQNAAFGGGALNSNTTGGSNTGLGAGADVSTGGLLNATAIGNNAIVNASNKVRIGNTSVSVIEGQVAYTFTSDKNQKENFRPVDGNLILWKIRDLDLTSWNYKGQDPAQFRHYGPMAQEFFAAFGHDGVGTSGSPTTINSGDETGILMIAIQALEKRTQEVDVLKSEIAELREMIRAQANQQK